MNVNSLLKRFPFSFVIRLNIYRLWTGNLKLLQKKKSQQTGIHRQKNKTKNVQHIHWLIPLPRCHPKALPRRRELAVQSISIWGWFARRLNNATNWMPPTISWKSCHMKSTRSSRGCSHFGFYTLLSQLARGDMLEREHGATPKPLVEDSTNIWHLSPCINPHTHAHTHTSTALQRYANLCSLCLLSTKSKPDFYTLASVSLVPTRPFPVGVEHKIDRYWTPTSRTIM